MKLCIDCIHYRPDVWTDGKCDVLASISPVTGKIEGGYCGPARMNGGKCGPEAHLFEPLNTQEAA